jgi:hypothetical protein
MHDILETRAHGSKIYKLCRDVEQSNGFNIGIVAVIAVNTIICGLDHHPMSDSELEWREMAN